jgi:hypothetical protein
VFLVGDTEEGDAQRSPDQFDRSPVAVVREMVAGGVSLPWNLALSAAIGLWLLFTRLTLGAAGNMANVDHVIGSLVLTVVSLAAAEVARPLRYLNVSLGVALLATPFLVEASTASTANSLICGAALVALSLRRGPIRERYGTWDRVIV